MAESSGELARRRWADVVVIVAGVYELMLSLFGGVIARPGGLATRVEAPGWYFASTAISGVLAIAAVLLALRSTVLARVLCGAAGVVLLTTLFAFESIDVRAVVNIILPAVLLLGATPFLGPMPTPEQEGEHR